MKAAILIRSGSFNTPSQLVIGHSRGSEGYGSGIYRNWSISFSPRSALHLDAKVMMTSSSSIRRARSDSDLIISDLSSRICPPPTRLPEEDEEDNCDPNVEILGGATAATVTVPEEELEFSGGGRGKGRKIGGGGGGGSDQNENRRIYDYYQEMLSSDPTNPLLLRNYGKFLHEVEGDVKGAEECYSRAILASPKDGDVLCLYGKLVWETHMDKERAGGYFERAVEASPDDCYILASYASFLWDTEEDGGEEGGDHNNSDNFIITTVG